MGTLIQSARVQAKDDGSNHQYSIPIIDICSIYNQTKAHNMLAIMLDMGTLRTWKLYKILWVMHMPFKL
jgi:hypothetical protein